MKVLQGLSLYITTPSEQESNNFDHGPIFNSNERNSYSIALIFQHTTFSARKKERERKM